MKIKIRMRYIIYLLKKILTPHWQFEKKGINKKI